MPLGSVEGVEQVGECNNVQDDDACDHSRLAGYVHGRLGHQALRLLHACDSHASKLCQSRSSAKSSQCVILLRGATYIWSDKKACKVDSMHLEVMQCTGACS